MQFRTHSKVARKLFAANVQARSQRMMWYTYDMKFGMLQVRKNEIPLRKWSSGTVQMLTNKTRCVSHRYGIASRTLTIFLKNCAGFHDKYFQLHQIWKYLKTHLFEELC